ncbi:MAG: hypothetical protein MHM6MM_004371 [Cercozoa sp. M6MM]
MVAAGFFVWLGIALLALTINWLVGGFFVKNASMRRSLVEFRAHADEKRKLEESSGGIRKRRVLVFVLLWVQFTQTLGLIFKADVPWPSSKAFRLASAIMTFLPAGKALTVVALVIIALLFLVVAIHAFMVIFKCGLYSEVQEEEQSLLVGLADRLQLRQHDASETTLFYRLTHVQIGDANVVQMLFEIFFIPLTVAQLSQLACEYPDWSLKDAHLVNDPDSACFQGLHWLQVFGSTAAFAVLLGIGLTLTVIKHAVSPLEVSQWPRWAALHVCFKVTLSALATLLWQSAWVHVIGLFLCTTSMALLTFYFQPWMGGGRQVQWMNNFQFASFCGAAFVDAVAIWVLATNAGASKSNASEFALFGLPVVMLLAYRLNDRERVSFWVDRMHEHVDALPDDVKNELLHGSGSLEERFGRIRDLRERIARATGEERDSVLPADLRRLRMCSQKNLNSSGVDPASACN